MAIQKQIKYLSLIFTDYLKDVKYTTRLNQVKEYFRNWVESKTKDIPKKKGVIEDNDEEEVSLLKVSKGLKFFRRILLHNPEYVEFSQMFISRFDEELTSRIGRQETKNGVDKLLRVDLEIAIMRSCKKQSGEGTDMLFPLYMEAFIAGYAAGITRREFMSPIPQVDYKTLESIKPDVFGKASEKTFGSVKKKKISQEDVMANDVLQILVETFHDTIHPDESMDNTLTLNLRKISLCGLIHARTEEQFLVKK